eukprot:CAMPEP_0183830970 /NCGR_PEP_ID=MMETSP0807_2-20130328/4342_1 /TAXON_ID=88271 /ORGANISM="Picocystis salinarum, Strain CCMP1897" /LENGTH=676 /DNA_ID=CAMNT_0026076373 /DNA_START=295 /DNA_END=2325 /DNA_ORIENTATION=-
MEEAHACDESMAKDAATHVRIHVGGLTPQVTHELLSRRFEPFGEVSAVHLAPPSAHGMWRGFGFVTLRPHSEKELRKCLLAYHRCKWMGGTMRVQKAKPDFRERLRHEWEQERRNDVGDEERREGTRECAQPTSKSKIQKLLVAGRRPGQFVDTAKAVGVRKKRVHFRDVVARPLDWNCPQRPADLREWKQMEAWKSLVDAGLVENDTRDVSSSEGEEDAGAVLNFVSDQEEEDQRHNQLRSQAHLHDLDRFDSDSDTKSGRIGAGALKMSVETTPTERIAREEPATHPPGREDLTTSTAHPSEGSVSSIEEYIKAIHRYNPEDEEASPVLLKESASAESSPADGSGSASSESRGVDQEAEGTAREDSETEESKEQMKDTAMIGEQPFIPQRRESQGTDIGLDRFDDLSSADEGDAGASNSSSSQQSKGYTIAEEEREMEDARALEEEREKQRSLLHQLCPEEESKVLHVPKQTSVFQPIGRFDPTKFTPTELMQKYRVPEPARLNTRGKKKVAQTPAREEKLKQEKDKTPANPAPPRPSAPVWDAYQKSSWTDLVGNSGAMAWSFSAPTDPLLTTTDHETGTTKSFTNKEAVDFIDGRDSSRAKVELPPEILPPATLDPAVSPIASAGGHTFMRTQDKEVLESAWESQRSALLEDFKRKRRAALRALPKRRPRHQ